MSTADSILLVATSAVVRDVYQRCIKSKNPTSDSNSDNDNNIDYMKISKLVTICIIVLVIILSLKPVLL